jgi:hypothetical protein
MTSLAEDEEAARAKPMTGSAINRAQLPETAIIIDFGPLPLQIGRKLHGNPGAT